MTAFDKFRERECLICGAIFRPKRATHTTFCSTECQNTFPRMAAKYVRAGLQDGSISLPKLREHVGMDFRAGGRVPDDVMKEQILSMMAENGRQSSKQATLCYFIGASKNRISRLRKELARDGLIVRSGHGYKLTEEL